MLEKYSVIIVGGGHAACQAAQVCSLMKLPTLMITPNVDTIGFLSCNVSMGGVGKSQMMREMDALGVDIASLCTDMSATSMTILNRSKGPAMHSHHAILDKALFKSSILSFVQNLPFVDIFQQTVKDVIVENNKATGVITDIGLTIRADSVILCAGTFLNGKIHIGLDNYTGGRAGEAASISLAQRLKELNLPQGRMKTGTPPRLDGKSIDFSKLTPKWGDGVEDNNVPVLSLMGNKSMHPQQLACWNTRTNQNTHDILKSGFDRSPFIQAHFEGLGPRYCPSIEDKITRFADKDSHQIILEPEGLSTTEFYPNGISTSLPFDIQLKAVRSMIGLEQAIITRPGYAIEYDFYDPTGFKRTLEFKDIEHLYIAGTPLGTSGYAEAQATGTIAAINCCLKLKEQEPWIPQRSEAYLGVLLDDLTTKGVTEPYRMLTSRAEYRLSLREDNADQRLTPIGYKLGLISEERWQHFCEKQEAISQITQSMKTTWLQPSMISGEKSTEYLGSEITREFSLADLLKRPQVSYQNLFSMPEIQVLQPSFTMEALAQTYGETQATTIAQQVDISFKYEGYITQQTAEIQKMSASENMPLPKDFDYFTITALSTEVKQKLNQFKPETVGQASRITGVSASAMSLILIYLKKNKLLQKRLTE